MRLAYPDNPGARRGFALAWLAGSCFLPAAEAIAGPVYYEDASGLIVAEIVDCSSDDGSQVGLGLAGGRNVLLFRKPGPAGVYRLSGDGKLEPTSEPPETQVCSPSARAFSYDPAAQLILIARPGAQAIDVLAFAVTRAGPDVFHIEPHSGGTVLAASPAVAARLRQAAGIADAQDKAAMFLAAKNHPSKSGDIRSLTTAMRKDDAVWYAGVLKRVSRRSLTLTTWEGDVTVKLRSQPKGNDVATWLVRNPSPKTGLSAGFIEGQEYGQFEEILKLDPGQFVRVYAHAKTGEAEWVMVYHEPDS